MNTVTDDLGHIWRYDAETERIRMDDDDSEPQDERGYVCDSFEEGVALLKEYGYISGGPYDVE